MVSITMQRWRLVVKNPLKSLNPNVKHRIRDDTVLFHVIPRSYLITCPAFLISKKTHW